MKTKQVLSLSQFLNEAKMSLMPFSLLAAVSENPNRRINDLAMIVGTSTANVSIHIKKLQKAKFLIKTNSQEDERVTYVALSDLGKEFLTKTLAFVNDTVVAAAKPEKEKVLAPVVKRAQAAKKAVPNKKKRVVSAATSNPQEEPVAAENVAESAA